MFTISYRASDLWGACLRKQAPSPIGRLGVCLGAFLLDPLAAVITRISVHTCFGRDREKPRHLRAFDYLPPSAVVIIPRPNVRQTPAPVKKGGFQEAKRCEGTTVGATPLVAPDQNKGTDDATEDRNAKR